MTHDSPLRPLSVSVCLALLTLALFACRSESALPPPDQQQLSFSRIVDLSHIVAQDMPSQPGTLPPTLNRPSPDGARDVLAFSTRSGSRVTASGAARAASVEHLSAQQLVAPAVVLDLRDAAQDSPAYRIDSAAIDGWERTYGPIPPDSIVLLATGWDMRWSTPGAYMNLDAAGRVQAPSIDASALALLLARGVRGVGIDTPRLAADGVLLPPEASWLVLEDLTSLEQLPARGATLVIGALKLQASSASPSRVFAFVP